MTQAPQDWHPEKIKAAIRMKGLSLSELSRQHGLSDGAVRRTLTRAWPRVQAIIAKHLGLAPQTIWPSRYDHRGKPLPGLHAISARKRSAQAPAPHRQKSEAA